MNSNPISFFSDGEIPQRIISLVAEAKTTVVLVTPYLTPWRYLTESLLQGIKKGINTVAIVRDEPNITSSEGVKWLVTNGAKVLAVPGLHAKIYMNDQTIIVSSLNLTEQSLNMSHDIALLVTDAAAKEAIRNYVTKTLLPAASPINFREYIQNEQPKFQNKTVVTSGFCIRCGLAISLNRDKPLCNDCFGVWSNYENEDFEENFCHSCGKPWLTSYAKPLCRSCYTQMR